MDSEVRKCIFSSFLLAASDGISDGLITCSGNSHRIRSEIDTSIFLLAVPSGQWCLTRQA